MNHIHKEKVSNVKKVDQDHKSLFLQVIILEHSLKTDLKRKKKEKKKFTVWGYNYGAGTLEVITGQKLRYNVSNLDLK